MAKKQQELEWQAEADVDTLARYEEIISDGPRMKRATKLAQQRAKDLTKRAATMSNIGKRKK